MEVDPSPAQQRTSRKHLRSSDEDGNSDWSSDVSGRFDDAAEEPELQDYKSPSAKSVKRRRSNDWPLPEEAADYGHHDRRTVRNGHTTAALGPGYKVSPRASPRTSAASLRGRLGGVPTNSPRTRLGRRSRFVEATMSDSVSEKPPSIFMHDGKPAGPRHRQSGIFRFGKAIASAFNPFGGWGKSSPENVNPQPPTDALSQAEQAYAELKKAGYKGTNKSAHMQSHNASHGVVDPANADRTWQAIQEKMDYGSTMGGAAVQTGDRVDIHTPSRSTSKSSKRSSFQDLRSLGLPFMRQHDPPSSTSIYQERTSEESNENTGLRKQKSRKELSRQTKLLKKVSNLEDKLERARRELRQLSGSAEPLPAPTPDPKSRSMDMDPGSYPRKFVPGALPTLPSERLLDQQAMMAESPESYAAELTAFPSLEGRGSASLEDSQSAQSTTGVRSPSRRPRESRPSSTSKESPSRKRKSPVPEPIASRPPIYGQPNPTRRIDTDIDINIDNDRDDDRPPKHDNDLIDFGLLSPPRQAKWQKFEAGDSPGSIERKRNVDLFAQEAPGSMHKRSPSAQPRSSPAATRSPKSKAVRSPPPLRMKRGHSHLRSVSPAFAAAAPESYATATPDVFSSSPAPNEIHHAFYLQQHCQLDPDRSPSSSPSKSSPSRKRRWQDRDIPPVPPLPKELLLDAAKVNESPRKKSSTAKNRAAALEAQTSSVQNQQTSGAEKYSWPDDIF
ncbi:uncharacterized protein N7482_005591 [Penicillium canariense]|uniref:Nuclear RNA binding protein n=1 Tax=Penicillium canariense TaxID=189055 RepID=A0A9W9LNC6_9EURO|nr:uncharacterized protein N7482_005591 [Penicillium canariense]KAJ5166810.1 hypothetical protein N7482_005591 [Penicillium canariense]